MKVQTDGVKQINAMWDSGSTTSVITFNAANWLKLKGKRTKLSIVKVGKEEEIIDSYMYSLVLKDKGGAINYFKVYGIDEISSNIQYIDTTSVRSLFTNVTSEELKRPSGKVDLLVGFKYAAFHPVMVQNCDHLVFMRIRFGVCLGCSHLSFIERTHKLVQSAQIHYIKCVVIEDFLLTEGLGVSTLSVWWLQMW